MKEILLANIGNRNIRYNGEFIEKSYDKQSKEEKKFNFYEFTKLIYENIEDEKANIKIEIVDSILEKYLNIQELYLFTTNQNPPFKQDTFYATKIIEYLLKYRYKINTIEIKFDPRNREKTFKFFERFFQKNNFNSKNNIYISGSGGVPAMKEALNFYSVMNFNNSIILDVDEKTNETFLSNIQKEYLKNFDKKILKKMIEKFNYSGAYTFIKKSRIKNIELENYFLYASYKYNFNFDKSNNLARGIKSKLDLKIENNKGENIENRLIFFKIMILELFDNLEITFKKGEYISFLGKIFSLQENIIRYLFEKEFKINTEKDFYKLKELGVLIREINERKKFVEIFELTKKLEKLEKDDIKEFFRFYKNLENLKNLRNKSIIAHSFGGIKREDLEGAYKNIINFKKNYWGIRDNFFININNELLNKLN